MSKSVTIRDVAKLAGLSPTTVSHALTGNRPVSAATRERVLDAARHLGYRPHPGARSLKAASTGVLAICITNLTGGALPFAEMDYYFRVTMASTEVAMTEGYALVTVPDAPDGRFWDRILFDGALVVDPVASDRNVAAVESLGLPIVTVGRSPALSPDDYWVDNDPAEATRTVLDHFAARGAQSIAAISWLLTDHWTPGCITAYQEWCSEHGMVPRLEIVSADTDAALREAAQRLLTRNRPDAVYGLAERPALTVLQVAADLGIRVPEDVMVAGPADFGLGPKTEPPMTTLEYGSEELGRAAAEMLVQLVRGEEPAERHLIVPCKLVERESTAR